MAKSNFRYVSFVIIQIKNRQRDLPISHEFPKIRRIITTIIAFEKQNCNEVSVDFISDLQMRLEHARFFNDPSSTDCMSFPMDPPTETNWRVLGSIFVCPHEAIKYSKKHKCDPYHELTLYIVHGLLHLLGYDDIQDKDRKVMRQKERKYMNYLALLGLILSKN